jgi:hypothetical protein
VDFPVNLESQISVNTIARVIYNLNTKGLESLISSIRRLPDIISMLYMNRYVPYAGVLVNF